MRLVLSGDAPHIDDGFGEVRPLREDEAQALALSMQALAEPDPDVEALLPAALGPALATWRRALALSVVGAEGDATEIEAIAGQLAKASSDPAAVRAYFDGLMGAGHAWRRVLEGQVTDLAKARRWITAHPNGPGTRGIPLLIEGTAGGGAKIIGGAGGKLNGQELGKLKPGAGGEAKGAAGAETAKRAPLKPVIRNADGSADPWMGQPLPPSLARHKAKAAAFIREYHAMRRNVSAASERGEQHVDARRLLSAMRALSPEFGDDNEDLWTKTGGAMREWAEGYIKRANEHEPLTGADADIDVGPKQTMAQYLRAQRDSDPARRAERNRASMERRAKQEAESAAKREEGRQTYAAQQAEREAASKQWQADQDAKKDHEAKSAAEQAVRNASMDARREDEMADRSIKNWRSSAGKAGPGRARAMLEALDAGEPWPYKPHPNDAPLVGADRRPSPAGRKLLAELRAQGVAAVPPEAPAAPARQATARSGNGRQQPLFKSRLIVPIRARLAKSTLAPVATPAREVTVGGRLAYWRESEGRGVLQIPLDTGKSLLVLARDLALALVDGAEELARVLSGQPPARALIAKLGLLKTARKTA